MVTRWKSDRVRIVGAGAIGRGLATALAASVPGVALELYSRSPSRAPLPFDIKSRTPAPFDIKRERGARTGPVKSLDELAPAEAPVVLCLAAREREIIATELARGAAEVPRAAVAAASVRALDAALDWAALDGTPVLVVTNPVELVCELVARRAPGAHVLGFGMATDRERIVEALRRGFDLDAGPLAITGLHGRRAVPAVSDDAVLAARLGAADPDAVAARLARTPGRYEISAGRSAEILPRLLERGARPADALHAVVRAITAAEFDGAQPPVARPVARLAAQVRAWLAGDALAEPEVSGPHAHRGRRVFAGGTLTASGFAVPRLGAEDAALLARELDAHLAQVDQLLGGAA